MFRMFMCFALFLPFACSAYTYRMEPAPREGQSEFFVQGETILISNQHNEVRLRPTSEILKNGVGAFHLECFNLSEHTMNLYFENLTAWDQHGREIPIRSRDEVIRGKKKRAVWAGLFTAIAGGLEAYSAQEDGTITYSETDHYGRTTHGTMYSSALERQSQNEVNRQNQENMDAIRGDYAAYRDKMKAYYLMTNTLLPQTGYDGYFLISVPRDYERELEYIDINLALGEENHTFRYYLHKKQNRRRGLLN